MRTFACTMLVMVKVLVGMSVMLVAAGGIAV